MTNIDGSKSFNQDQKDGLLPILDREWHAIVIASSTGGPKTLTSIFEKLPKNANALPIFIVQHMPKGFTLSFAKRLDSVCALKVKEAEQGEIIQRGHVYVAPGDYHMMVEENRIILDQKDKYLGVRPAADYLFQSAAPSYQDKLLSIILTGMGRDGTEGIRHIKKYGGINIAQDKASSVVFGMPGSAIKTKNVDLVLSMEEISRQLNILIKR